MKDNRRNFIKKGASIAAGISIGGAMGANAGNANIISPMRNGIIKDDLTKDAGMQLCLAYFAGKEPLKIQMAKQMEVHGAVGGINPRMVGMEGAMNYDLKVIKAVKEAWDEEGLKLTVIEGPPSLYTKTKLGLDGRDEEIENFITLMKNLTQVGINTICYNWMPLISWARSDKAMKDRGGALVMGFDINKIEGEPITEYGEITHEDMWDNLEYFLKAVMPEAEQLGMNLSMHGDDPPIDSIRNIPRIMTSVANFKRLIDIYPSPHNGITWGGTFGEMGGEGEQEDLEAALKYFTDKKVISFVHFRNVRGYKEHFNETFIDDGQMDMAKLMQILYDSGFKGPIRPDHVPTMGDDTTGFPGYTTLGTLFAIGYMRGLIDMARGTTLTKPA
ncbi:mannonate dehydratase [Leeuwenhoekiella sp. A16]|uniref:mannonate dehydratase n=1 Tax=unclassified Leeuwenhoekiella TaxID=2615029 RepID=UPI003A809332